MIRPVQQPERDTHNVDVADGDNPLRPGRETRAAQHVVAVSSHGSFPWGEGDVALRPLA